LPAINCSYGSVCAYTGNLTVKGVLNFEEGESLTASDSGTVIVEDTGMIYLNTIIRDTPSISGSFINEGKVIVTIANDELENGKTYKLIKKGGTGSLEIKAKTGLNYTFSVVEEDGYICLKANEIVEDSKAIPVPEKILEVNGVPTVFVGEHNDIKIKIDENIFSVNTTDSSAIAPMFIENGRTYLGVRDIADALGVDPMAIKWDDGTKTATISKSGAIVEITQGSSVIKLTYKGYIYEVESDASALIRNDRIYLPFRALFQIFGYTVEWDNATRTITCK